MGIGKIRHWTPRYIYNRLAVIIYLKRHPDTPWLTQTSIAMLESWLRPTDRGLEWGSGRSTAWFAARTAHLRSIEHDPQWAKKVENVLRQRASFIGLRRLAVRLGLDLLYNSTVGGIRHIRHRLAGKPVYADVFEAAMQTDYILTDTVEKATP